MATGVCLVVGLSVLGKFCNYNLAVACMRYDFELASEKTGVDSYFSV
jgi:hypothetical protein